MRFEEKLVLIAAVGIFLAILLSFLASPATGRIAGYTITMPIVGWIGIAALLVFSVIVYIRRRI
ncbi:MAG: hypothetical protein V1731_01440 [Candidatus Aenigmatarchaeota archaeon]